MGKRDSSLERKRQVGGKRYEVRGKIILNISILSFTQTQRNQLSTSRRLVLLSLQKGAAFCNFPLVVFCILSFYKRIFRFTPAICTRQLKPICLTMRNFSILMESKRTALQTAPFLNARSKYDTQHPVSSFKADLPAIYETPMIRRHSRQAIVSNPSKMGDS